MSKRSLIFLLVLIMVLAVACGGGDTETESTETEGETSPATNTPQPAEPTTAPQVSVEEATEPPPPTIAPTPTEEPTAEVVSSSGGDETQGSGEAASAGEGWGESGSGAQSACDHPYFPMRVGSTWTYSDGENTLTWEVTDIQGDMEDATADLRATIDDLTIDYVWDCGAGSGMASFDFASLGIASTGTGMTIENQSMDGVFLPPADQLQIGATWETTLVGTFTFSQTVGDTSMEVTGDLTTRQEYTVDGTDPVTFEDQTVEGIQVGVKNTIEMIMNVMGSSVSQDLSLDGSYEMGRGIGMLRQVFDSDFGEDRLELVSYYIP